MIGRLIRNRRIVRGWSQRELAEATRTTATAISQLERGVRPVPRATMETLGAALGITLPELSRMAGVFEPRPDSDPDPDLLAATFAFMNDPPAVREQLERACAKLSPAAFARLQQAIAEAWRTDALLLTTLALELAQGEE